ncbi:imm11 family protein [Stenotrophomonas sp. NPDC078853]|uniref:imm11 family protein n=1 Tax=Stenotrophomonas sp. NPDC078853 TaxID=3364534 RepID=UPI00384DD35C
MKRKGTHPFAEGVFFMFGPESESNRRFRGAHLENIQQPQVAQRLILRPDAGGFPPLNGVPRVVFDPSEGPAPRDLEGGFGGYWLVSERLQRAMSVVDPEAFAFVECEVRLADGSAGPRRFLCDVVREVDALDEEASQLRIKVDDDYVRGKFYSLGGGARLVFKRDILAGAHVFLTPFNPSAFCDRTFRSAVQAAGISLDAGVSGISFVDVTDI